MSGNRKVTPEEKLQAIHEYLDGKGGFKAIAKNMVSAIDPLGNGFINIKRLKKVHLLKHDVDHVPFCIDRVVTHCFFHRKEITNIYYIKYNVESS